MIILSDHIPKRAIEVATETAGEGGEVFFLRIFPSVVSEVFAEVEEHDAGAKLKRNQDARTILDQCVEYGKNEWGAEGEQPKFSYLMREGPPIDIATSFTDSSKPDLIILPEKDSQRLGSFALGDIVESLRKRTGIPLRVVG